MRYSRSGRIFFLFTAWLLAAVWAAPFAPATFYGDVPTGLMQLTDFQYPVYLFVPENYKPDRDYALMISLPAGGEKIEEHIKGWIGAAKRRSMLVMVPSVMSRQDETPFVFDQWLLKVKAEIQNRYQISKQRIYLLGKGENAHYAAYLGANYPEEFSSVGVLGGSWVGPYDKLIRPSKNVRRQIPFYIVLDEKDTGLLAQTVERAGDFEKAGYPVYLEKVRGEDAFSADEFKKKLILWLDEKGQDWRRLQDKQKMSWKGRLGAKWKDFFRV